MKRYWDEVLSATTGLPAVGATVDVFLPGTTTHVTLYSANDLGSSHLANPVVTGIDGTFYFYVADGTYDLRVISGSTTITSPDVEIYDLDELAQAKSVSIASAATATAQAGIATTQAGIATTQAGLLSTANGVATTQAGIATTQAGIAAAAALATQVQVWASRTTPPTGVASGSFYWVVDNTQTYLLLYLNTSGTGAVASPAVSLPLASIMMALAGASATTVAGPVPLVVSGNVATTGTTYYWPTTVQSYDQTLSLVEFVCGSTLASGEIVVAKVDTGGDLDLISTTPIWAPMLTAQARAVNIAVPAGCVVGLFVRAGDVRVLAGTIPNSESMWTTTGVPGQNMTKTVVTSGGIKARFTLRGLTAQSNVDVPSNTSRLGAVQTIGWSSPIATGSGSSLTVIPYDAAQSDCTLTRASIGSVGGGAGTIYVVTVNPYTNQIASVVSSTAITLLAGVVNVFNLNIPVLKGQRIAVEGPLIFGGSPAGGPEWHMSGTPTVGAALTASGFRFEVELEMQSGLTASITLGARSSASNVTTLLNAADNTGVVDATAIFTTARSTNPQPYVPPGTYSVTSLPAGGDGFWGPGEVFVNGERFFIPSVPQLGNLCDRLRTSLMDVIASDGLVILFADSIGTNSYAPTGPEHWFNRFTRFANIGVAKDEPLQTALAVTVSGNFDPIFYGVTITGARTYGTTGPVKQSVILAAGASISFTGAYEQVDVFYKQVAGMGNIEFKYNGGAAYKTINNAAVAVTDLDHYSGVSATGQAASGTYSITAVGGPVELCGLVRLGVAVAQTGQAALNKRRLRTMRAAMGGYAFRNFDATAVTSALKQAAAYTNGGPVAAMIDLGTNDMFSYSPATVAADQLAFINLLKAGGVAANRIYGSPPYRPGENIMNFTGGRSYEPAVGAIRKTYRDAGSIIVPSDAIDFAREGLLSDNIHPAGPGQSRKAQAWIEGIVAAA